MSCAVPTGYPTWFRNVIQNRSKPKHNEGHYWIPPYAYNAAGQSRVRNSYQVPLPLFLLDMHYFSYILGRPSLHTYSPDALASVLDTHSPATDCVNPLFNNGIQPSNCISCKRAPPFITLTIEEQRLDDVLNVVILHCVPYNVSH